MADDDQPTLFELQANLDYVKERSRVISDLLEALMDFQPYLSRFTLNPEPHLTLISYLSNELLRNETDKQIFESDLAKETWLENMEIN